MAQGCPAPAPPPRAAPRPPPPAPRPSPPLLACRLARAGLFPVDEEKPARGVELRLARTGQDLELELFDLISRAVPAREREIAVPPRARQKHHVDHGVVRH